MRKFVLALGVCLALFGLAREMPAQNLEQQLVGIYPTILVDETRTHIAQLGTVLEVRKKGLSAAQLANGLFVNNVRKGRITHGFMSEMQANANSDTTPATPLQVGDRLMLAKIEVKESNVAFLLLACGDCNSDSVNFNVPQTKIVFQFGKNATPTLPVQQIQEAISEVLVPLEAPKQSAVAPPPPPPSQEPAHIELGQTIDQVTNALGQPDNKISLGAKQIFVYRSIKVTFQDGKVSDVQ